MFVNDVFRLGHVRNTMTKYNDKTGYSQYDCFKVDFHSCNVQRVRHFTCHVRNIPGL